MQELKDAAALGKLGAPAILKTRRFGYDGKGQVRLDADSVPAEAWAAIGGVPSVLEGFVAFDRKVSVIAARGLDGAVAAFDPGENEHQDGIHGLAGTGRPPGVEQERENAEHVKRVFHPKICENDERREKDERQSAENRRQNRHFRLRPEAAKDEDRQRREQK